MSINPRFQAYEAGDKVTVNVGLRLRKKGVVESFAPGQVAVIVSQPHPQMLVINL